MFQDLSQEGSKTQLLQILIILDSILRLQCHHFSTPFPDLKKSRMIEMAVDSRGGHLGHISEKGGTGRHLGGVWEYWTHPGAPEGIWRQSEPKPLRFTMFEVVTPGFV